MFAIPEPASGSPSSRLREMPDDPELDADRLTDAEVDIAARELGGALSRTQQNRDEFVRVIAAGAVAVTASLIVALGEVGVSGASAIALAAMSLIAVLASFWTAEASIRRRRRAALRHDSKCVRPEDWRSSRFTDRLNAAAGLFLIAASAALVVFVITHGDREESKRNGKKPRNEAAATADWRNA